MGVAVQSDLVPFAVHIPVDGGEVGFPVEKRRADGEEGDFNILLFDNPHYLLCELGDAVVDGKGEGIRACAGKVEGCGGEFRRDLHCAGCVFEDFDFPEGGW